MTSAGPDADAAEVGTEVDQALRPGSVHRTLHILEVVAARGGASAKEISDATGLPLPTVYRLARELLDSDYLVHIREERRFELGYKLHQLGVSLHQQIGVPREVPRRGQRPARAAGAGGVLRGPPGGADRRRLHRRLPLLPPACGRWSSASTRPPHATALGKVLLADMTPEQRQLHLGEEPMPRFGPGTITRHDELAGQLARIADRGLAWEHGEFQTGATCVAAAVRAANGVLVGSVAVSGPDARLARAPDETEAALRASASRVSRFYRAGRTEAR